jgi:LysM repeat protein
MIGDAMVAKSARYVAPIALAAVAVVTYLIVHKGLSTHHTPVTPSGNVATGHHHRHRHRTPKFYVVKSGDTLSQISVKTHVPIIRIMALNPRISPNALQTGQRLRLRR